MVVKTLLKKWFAFLVITIAVLWTLLPLIDLVLVSFAGPGSLPTGLRLPRRLTMNNWRNVLFGDRIIWPFMLNSLIVGCYTCAITLIVALPAAYSFSRHQSRLHNSVFRSMLILRIIPQVTLAIPIFFLLNKYRLLDTRIGLSFAHLIITIPLAVWLMKGYYDLLSPEIEESAIIDGANWFQVLWRISIPLSAPGVAVTFMFCFLFSYIEYMYALIITRQSTFTLPIMFGTFMTHHETHWRLIACSSLISMIPMVILFSLLQKNLIRGFTLGAFK